MTGTLAYPQQRSAGRVLYRIRRGAGCFLVIADCREDGTWDFSESEGDEPRWHRFSPSAEELAYARRLLTAAAPADDARRPAPWFGTAIYRPECLREHLEV